MQPEIAGAFRQARLAEACEQAVEQAGEAALDAALSSARSVRWP